MQNDILKSEEKITKPVKDLEDAGDILVIGIMSLIGPLGLILAPMTLFKAKKALTLYKDQPQQYTESSYKKIDAGRTCAIVSLAFLGVGVLTIIAAVLLI